MSTHRRYQLKARAVRQNETRERIVTATEALHREVGPARTTIADIARRAGVERLTVYNHFPQLTQLLGACQAHFLMRHPPPDISPGPVTKTDALRHLEASLTQLYGWYRANQAMEENIHRDRLLLPELDALLRQSSDPVFDGAAAAYAQLIARTGRALPAARAVVRLALDFGTWKIMSERALSDSQAAKVLAGAVASLRSEVHDLDLVGPETAALRPAARNRPRTGRATHS